MDTNSLMVLDWLYKAIGGDLVSAMVRLLFVTACTSSIVIMLSVGLAFVNLAELIRSPARQNVEQHRSLWQSIKDVWPKKSIPQIKSQKEC